jgi:ABC-type Fe3+-hydroxamate transport system substrate-binding protein
VPSQTELLFDLGLEQEIVGITKFCIHPKFWAKQKPKIGGTKQFHFDRIEALKPDLIIANKEENYKEGIDYLAERYPVWISDIFTWQDAMQMIAQVGELTSRPHEAQALCATLQASHEQLKQASSQLAYPVRVLYLIWREPYMAVGKDTFIDDMLTTCGFENVCVHLSRYPELAYEDLKALAPDLIMLSSEPYPFRDKHITELKQIVPASRVELVDGEMFSWYGSRMTKGLPYMEAIVRLLASEGV